MSSITVNIRPSTGQIFQINIESENSTIQELKEIISKKMDNVEPSNLKLVFSGKILKNEDLVSECKIVSGCTIHVVRSGINKVKSTTTATASTSSMSTAATTSDTGNTTTPVTSDFIPPIPPTPSPSNLTGLGASPFGDMQMPNMDPEVMRQMMDSPFMQNIMNNTDFVRSIIMSNPQMKALVEQNPELGHVISDPAFLRQSMEMMRNPELMREMQRNNDRALSNIEAIPGGFNHLRRMYNTFQAPLESAATPSRDEANNERLARELNVQSVPENSLNTQALPNPWAAPASSETTNTNANSGLGNPFAALGSSSAGNPLAALGGSSAGNPLAAFGNSSTAGNPFATLGGSSTENPFAALFGGNSSPFSQTTQQQQQPQQQQQQTPFWADPNFVQASIRMQQALSQNNNANPQQQQQNLFQQLMMGGGFGSIPTQQNTTPTESPEVRFRDQLSQLEEMGFTEKAKNIRALLATGGNVQAAIEYLLSM